MFFEVFAFVSIVSCAQQIKYFKELGKFSVITEESF